MNHDDIIQMQKQNDYDLHNGKLDYFLVYHNSAEKRRIRSLISSKMSPVLIKHGFLRKGACFARIHGDALLQIVGAQYAGGLPGIYTYVYPLYDIYEQLSIPNWPMRSLIGLDNVHNPCIRSVESVAKVNDGVSYLNWQTDLDRPIEGEIELLSEVVLPEMDSCVSGENAIAFNHDDRRPNLFENLVLSVSFHLRDHDYRACVTCIDMLKARWIDDIDYIQNEYRSRVTENKDLETAVGARITAIHGYINYLERLRNMVLCNDICSLNELMNNGVKASYSYLCTIFCKLSTVYPIDDYLLPFP